MKKHFLSIAICVGISLSSLAQSENEIIASMDTTAFDGRIFLNKGGIIKELVDPFIKKDKDNAFVNMSARHFKYLYESVGRSNFEEKKAKPNKIDKFFEKTDYEIERNNVIPIGILVSDAILLTEKEIKENQKNKKEGKKVKKETYQTINIYTPCLLQDFAYQNDLYFELSKELVSGKQNSIIKGIEIDFQDGKGWQAYKIKDELIHHRFLTTGNVSIGLKLIT